MAGNGERGSSGMENKSRFTLEDWNAPVYIGAEELRHALVHMELENKVIHGFRLLDYSSVKLPEWDQTEEEVMIPVFAALSSPMIVLFTDGTRLEMYRKSRLIRWTGSSPGRWAPPLSSQRSRSRRTSRRLPGTTLMSLKSIRSLSTRYCSAWIPGTLWSSIPGDSRVKWIYLMKTGRSQ